MLRLTFLLVFFVSCFANASPNTECQQRHCLAVVDAGSTGSRLHIYAYDIDDKNTPIKIEQIWSKKIKPGLASIEPKPASMNAYLMSLFADAPEHALPVYFYATGGMRLVSQPKQQQYYKAVQEWFSQTSWTLLDAKTISGRQEGVFGWLSVNYSVGALQNPDSPLVGVMDMGGASVQLALPVEQANGIDPTDLMNVDIYDRHIVLFAHSFLGLGQTEVSHHYFNTASCFANDYPMPNESTGQGDASMCQQAISKLVNGVHDVEHIIKPIVTANPVSWYTLSGASSLVKNKPFVFENNQFTNQDLLQQAHSELCNQSWSALSARFPDNDYTFVNCLTSSYYYGLMVNGYGLNPSEAVHYMPGDEEADWTLGVVLQPQALG